MDCTKETSVSYISETTQIKNLIERIIDYQGDYYLADTTSSTISKVTVCISI